MAEKIIKTKIALRWLDYATWSAEAFQTEKPLRGEVWFCEVPEGNSNAQTAPTMLFKVGDGVNTFGALKWASALAADVYNWAKVAGGNVFTKEGAGNVISGIAYDPALNGGKGGFKYTTASVATAEGLDELQKDVAAIEKDIADNRDAWNKYEDTRYTFSNDGDKLVVKKTLYTNGVAGTEEEVGTYEFLTVDEVKGILADYYTKTELEGKIHTEDEIKAMEIAHATAAGKVDAAITVKVGGADVVFDGSEAKTADVDAAIAAAIDAIPDVIHPEYSIVKDAVSDYAATYHLTKDGVNVGAAINIPKDMVVEHGEVKELEAGVWGKAGTYIVITLANATDDKLYINVGALIEYVTSGSTTGDMVYVTVDPTTHKITATITDGTITEAKLHADVTAKLNKEWDEKGAAATAEQNAKDYADGLVENYGDIVTHNAAEFATNAENGAKALADENKAAIEAINNAETGILAQAKKDVGDKAAVVLGEAQKYADDKVAALAGEGNTTTVKAVADRVKDLEDANHISDVEADTGLKVIAGTNGANNKVAIDETVVFVLDCNW